MSIKGDSKLHLDLVNVDVCTSFCPKFVLSYCVETKNTDIDKGW